MKNKDVLIRKIILISVVVVALVAIIVGAYVGTNIKNKVTKENAFDLSSVKGYKEYSEDEFIALFDNFEFYAHENIDPIFSGKECSTKGRMKFTVNAKLKDNTKVVGNKFSIKVLLAASWINYRSDESSQVSVTSGTKSTSLAITTLDKLFPAQTNLLFVKVDHPTLYGLVTFQVKDSMGNTTNCYSIIDFSYSEFTAVPSAE